MKAWIVTGLLAAGLAVFSAFAWTAPPPHSAAAPRPNSLEQAVRQVQHQTHGHILAADTVSRGRTEVYRIKVLTPRGKVRVMQLHSAPRPSRLADPPHSDQGGH